MNIENYKEQFSRLKKTFSGFPSSEKKISSFQSFCENGWPTTRDENWRYSRLKKMSGTDYNNYPSSLSRPTALLSSEFDFPVSNLVFRNGLFDKQLSQLSRDAMSYIRFKDHGCISDLPERSQLHNASFFNLNVCFNVETFYIDIPANTVVAEPIVFNYVYDLDSDSMYHPQLDIIVGENSQVKFIEIHTSKETGQSLINPLTKFRVHKNAKVKHVRFSDMDGGNITHTGHCVGQLEENSSFHFASMNRGGLFNRLESEFFHEGENAYLEINGLCEAQGQEQINYFSRIYHEKGHGESHQLYKGVLADKSVSTFDGLIYIAPKAQKVNSSQMNKNLLLSNEAEVNTKPQLDINADDVKAAHGATVSELSDDEIFYLMSRGIDQQKAKKIIEKAFVDEVILKIGDLNIQKWLSNVVRKRD